MSAAACFAWVEFAATIAGVVLVCRGLAGAAAYARDLSELVEARRASESAPLSDTRDGQAARGPGLHRHVTGMIEGIAQRTEGDVKQVRRGLVLMAVAAVFGLAANLC